MTDVEKVQKSCMNMDQSINILSDVLQEMGGGFLVLF